MTNQPVKTAAIHEYTCATNLPSTLRTQDCARFAAQPESTLHAAFNSQQLPAIYVTCCPDRGDEVIATDSEDIAERVHQITG